LGNFKRTLTSFWISFQAPDCIEAGYAVLYFASIYSLGAAFFHWQGRLFERWNNLDVFTRCFESFCLAAMFASVIQFSRIYYYIHLFDRYQRQQQVHFISCFTGLHRSFDRLWRWAAGVCVIFLMERWGTNSIYEYEPNVDTHSLYSFPVLLLAVFVFLLFWDINLFVWKKRGGLRELNHTQIRTLKQYNAKLKVAQRISGIAFSLLLLCLLNNPKSPWRLSLFCCSLSIFVLAWFVDYIPPRFRLWNSGSKRRLESDSNWFFDLLLALGTFLFEVLSPLITIISLLMAFIPSSESSNTTSQNRSSSKTQTLQKERVS